MQSSKTTTTTTTTTTFALSAGTMKHYINSLSLKPKDPVLLKIFMDMILTNLPDSGRTLVGSLHLGQTV